MKKLYEKNELLFAILWIVAYVVIAGTVRGNFGDESVIMTAVLAVFAVVIFVFVKTSHLEERYGLCKWKGKAGDYWFFIPPLILMTGNLWRGIGMEYSGFIEEMIFRGFLFRILLKKDPAPVAITISAVTFGIGHIVNLFTGQSSFETVIQVFFAIAWGFIFTVVFYKSGSLLMCIIAHSLNNAFAKFNAESEDMTLAYIYIGASIVTAIIYCAYLSRKPAALKNE